MDLREPECPVLDRVKPTGTPAKYILLGLEIYRNSTLEMLQQLNERISFVVDSLAKMSPMQDLALDLKESDLVFGKNSIDSSIHATLDGSCWRTSQGCLFEDSELSSVIWPRAGMMRSGIVFLRPPLVPLTREIEYGLLPTPTATAYGKNQSASLGANYRPSLAQTARLFGLKPNPQFSEWCMGYGNDTTDIDLLSWETLWSRKSSNGLEDGSCKSRI